MSKPIYTFEEDYRKYLSCYWGREKFYNLCLPQSGETIIWVDAEGVEYIVRRLNDV